MGAKKLRFIYCVELILFLSAASGARAGQMVIFKPGVGPVTIQTSPVVTSTPTNSPTPTYTWDPSLPSPTATPSPTNTLINTATSTPTAGTPTNTLTYTFTPTITGTIPTSTMTFTPTPVISRASLVVMPTAYSNGWDHTDGFNWDVNFSYFIGSIISRDYHKSTDKLDSLEQINLILLTTDVKYAWLDEDGDLPGIASGLMMSALARVGSANSGAATTTQTIHVAGNTVGAVYTVMSKTLFKDMAVHFGYLYGLKDLSGQSNIFTMNYSQLLPSFGPGLTGLVDPANPESPGNMAYVGFNMRFLDRNWKFEIWKPWPMAENPILLNTQIEGLPLAFNLGYERWDHGYAILGYVNFRIPLLPSTPDY